MKPESTPALLAVAFLTACSPTADAPDAAAERSLDAQTLAAMDASGDTGRDEDASVPLTPDIPVFRIGPGRALHVAVTGDDVEGDGSISAPYLTINKAMSQVTPGDTINVHAGTYRENAATSPYTGGDRDCGGPTSCSIIALSSGTADAPITLRAFPGDEGRVTIDSENERIGLHAVSQDYWQIYGLRFINNHTSGIGSWGLIPDVELDLDGAATGWRIENVLISHTVGNAGVNTSGIAMWGTRGWLVHNVWVNDSTAGGTTSASGFQAYGVVEALIDHVRVDASAFGIFWKDHHLRNETTRERWTLESEIRYSEIAATELGIQIGIRGEASTEASHNHWHHNIIVGPRNAGLYENMAGSGRVSGFVHLDHNLVYAPEATAGIFATATEDLRSTGNIIIGGGAYLTFVNYAPTVVGTLRASDYNVLDARTRVGMSIYGAAGDDRWYPSLSAWQAATTSDSPCLGIDHPDAHSVVSTADALFVNAAGGDFHHAPGSPALGLMPDGSHAGPYQVGDEVIGLLPTYSAGRP